MLNIWLDWLASELQDPPVQPVSAPTPLPPRWDCRVMLPHLVLHVRPGDTNSVQGACSKQFTSKPSPQLHEQKYTVSRDGGMYVSSALRSLKQEVQKFKAGLGYLEVLSDTKLVISVLHVQIHTHEWVLGGM